MNEDAIRNEFESEHQLKMMDPRIHGDGTISPGTQREEQTITDLMQDPFFEQALEDRINIYRTRTAPEGLRLKRTPLDALADQGLLTPDGIVTAFKQIASRTQYFPRAQRIAVTALVGESLNATADHRKRLKNNEHGNKN